jgi:hypothetical protein
MAEIIYVMQDFIQTYDNVLDRQTCNTLIEKFDECDNNQLSSFASRENRQFTEVRLRDNMDFFKDEYETCLNAFTSIIERYKKDLLIGEIGLVGQKQHMNGLWPKKYGMEGIKIKKYLDNDTDMFNWHVDVMDGVSNQRFLAFFIYLDDNEAGTTQFVHKEINCTAGSALLFPPMWNYLHRGNKPIKKPKYLLQGYLHYLSPEALGEPGYWELEGVERHFLAGKKKESIDKIHELHKKYPNSEKVNDMMERINEG